MTARSEAVLKANTGLQHVRNEINSLRLSSERLAVAYVDSRFNGPGGTFENFIASTFKQFTCNGVTQTTEVLLDGQTTPWNSTTYLLQSIEPYGFYVIHLGYEGRNPTEPDRELIGRIVDTTSGLVVSGTPSQDDYKQSVWGNYGIIIYFTAPANATGRNYRIDLAHYHTNFQIGRRSITVGRLA